MRIFNFLPVAFLGLFFVTPGHHLIKAYSPARIDSGNIVHTLNGSIDEWPAEKFTTDKETDIMYAIDNDAQNLYLALKITNMGEQIKMMSMGMRLFIDLKGKHKEDLSVEFPVKRSDGFSNPGAGLPPPPSQSQGDEQRVKPDMKLMRMRFVANIISMNLFGFSDEDQLNQDLETEGSVMIAYDWDSTNVMHIEYLLPLKMLDDKNSLDQKTISIGWKVKGLELPSGSGAGSGRPGGAGSSGGRPSGRSGGGRPGGGSQADFDKMSKEQQFWAKYTFTIPTVLKGF